RYHVVRPMERPCHTAQAVGPPEGLVVEHVDLDHRPLRQPWHELVPVGGKGRLVGGPAGRGGGGEGPRPRAEAAMGGGGSPRSRPIPTDRSVEPGPPAPRHHPARRRVSWPGPAIPPPTGPAERRR